MGEAYAFLQKIAQIHSRAPIERHLEILYGEAEVAGLAFLSGCACWELVVALEQRIRPDETRFTVEVRLAGLGFEPLSERTGRIQDRAGAVDGARGVWESPAR